LVSGTKAQCESPFECTLEILLLAVPNKKNWIDHAVRVSGMITALWSQGAAKKSNPLRFFAVFSAVAWNFKAKFYRHI